MLAVAGGPSPCPTSVSALALFTHGTARCSADTPHPAASTTPLCAPQDPQRFVELDPDMARTLLDQRDSGKMLLLITNSDYQ